MNRDQPRWHPILQATEGPPGHWVIRDAHDREYATVDIVRVDGQIRYRCELYGHLEGYAGTLKVACENLHGLMISYERGPSAHTVHPNGDAGATTRYQDYVRRRDEWRAQHR